VGQVDDRDEEFELSLPVVVPYQELSAAALEGVIEAFVLREGTDYGEREVSHAAKVASVRRQLERGEAQIVYEPADASIVIVMVPPKVRPGR
jgi:uncharacterized protein YheU (UPF0270 family)